MNKHKRRQKFFSRYHGLVVSGLMMLAILIVSYFLVQGNGSTVDAGLTAARGSAARTQEIQQTEIQQEASTDDIYDIRHADNASADTSTIQDFAKDIATSAPASDAFCGSLTTQENNKQIALANRRDALQAVWAKQTALVDKLANEQNQAITQYRHSADMQTEANYADMTSKATTYEDKRFVQAYIDSSKAAITARRAAADEARSLYISKVRSLLSNRHIQLSGQVEALRLTVSDAYAAAATSCAESANAPSSLAASTLQVSLQTSATSFQKERLADGYMRAAVNQMKTDRQASMRVTDDAYNTQMQTAGVALKTATASRIE